MLEALFLYLSGVCRYWYLVKACKACGSCSNSILSCSEGLSKRKKSPKHLRTRLFRQFSFIVLSKQVDCVSNKEKGQIYVKKFIATDAWYEPYSDNLSFASLFGVLSIIVPISTSQHTVFHSLLQCQISLEICWIAL